MKKIIILIALAFISSYALTLEDVKKGLSLNQINQDSLEYRLKVTVTAPMIGSQSTDYHYVAKGKSKIYFEMRSSLVNQRMILSGEKMKTTDLVTMKENISPYKGEIEKLTSSQNVTNPFNNGTWKTPERVEGSIYRIEGDSSTVYYDASKKRLKKMEEKINESSSLVTFEYDDATNQINRVFVSLMIGSQEIKVDMMFSVFRSSKNFPDRYFNF